MKKRIFVFLFITLTSLFGVAQINSKKVDVIWGLEQKNVKRSTLAGIIGYDNTGFYSIKSSKKRIFSLESFTLEHFDKEMTVSQSSQIELSHEKKEHEFESVLHLEGKMYLLSSYKNNRTKKNNLFVQSIDKKTLELGNDMIKIAEIDYSHKRKSNAGGFQFDYSLDSTKLLIYYNLPYDAKGNEKLGFHIFNTDFKQLWGKQITLPYKEKLFDVEDYRVDNNGNVYVLGTIYKEKKRAKRKGKPNYKYQILSYTDNGETLTEYPIEISGSFLTDMRIAVDSKGDITCAGYYSEKGTFSIKGSYFLKIDGETKKIAIKNFKEFGIDFVTQNMTKWRKKRTEDKAKRGKNVELYNYALDEIIIKSDGGAVLIGEQYYVKVITTRSTDPNGNVTTTTTKQYNYNDIIVVNISPEGEILWTEKIPKRQVTSDDGGFYSSYALSVVGDKLYFVFNDNVRNLGNHKEGKIYNFKLSNKSIVTLVEVDADGKVEKEAMFSAKDSGVLLRPKVCKRTSENEMILFGQRGKKQRYGKVTFKK